VFFLVKLSLAAIPAAIILGVIFLLVTAAIAAFLGGGDLEFLRRLRP
jgi:VIT1/CCC1 family predicted Fe2+/Mn2+ transporter